MASTVNVNFRTVVHQTSNGITTGFPDPCKTPTPTGPIPIPYPNIAQSTDADKVTKKVKVQGKGVAVKGSSFKMSAGNEAGTAGGGVVSNTTKGKAEFINYSFDVKFEGKNVARLMDLMLMNKQSAPNTPPFPVIQPPLPPAVMEIIVEAAEEVVVKLKNLEDTSDKN